MEEKVLAQDKIDNAPAPEFEDTTPEAQEKKKQKKKLPTGAKVAIIVVSIVLVLAILAGVALVGGILLVGGALVGVGLYLGLEYQDGDFYYRNTVSGVQITSYVGNDEVLEIPQTLGGKPVRKIDSFVFANTSIKVAIIPDTVLEIGTSAFEDCAYLEEVCMGCNVKEIDDFAFYGCTSLKNIVLSSSLEEIGRSAFAFCTSLYEIYIPYNVESIGAYAFEGCKLNWVSLETPYAWIVEDGESSLPLHLYVTSFLEYHDEISYEEAVAILLSQAIFNCSLEKTN